MRDFSFLRDEMVSLKRTLHHVDKALEENAWRIINTRSILQEVTERLSRIEKAFEDLVNNRYSESMTLLYKLAHHVRNGVDSEFMTTSWAAAALDILVELYNVDPEMYDLYVKKDVIG